MSEEEGIPCFPLAPVEAISVYSMLYEQSLRLPSVEMLIDEAERREMFPGLRHKIPKAMETRDNLVRELREFCTAIFGDDSVSELEAKVRKMREVTPK